MSYCSRVDQNCENKRKIICDTNFLINFLNFLANKLSFKYWEVFKSFKKLMNCIKSCSIDGCIYCSTIVYEKEFKKTVFYKVPFLKKLDGIYQKKFESVINSSLNITTTNEYELSDLIQFSNDFTENNSLNLVGEEDLSLILIALMELEKDKNEEFLIVTDDENFRTVILEVSRSNSISLNTKLYTNLKIIPIRSLPFLTTTYKCCKYDDLEDYGKFFLWNISSLRGVHIKQRKFSITFDWIANGFNEARLHKSKNSEVGICE